MGNWSESTYDVTPTQATSAASDLEPLQVGDQTTQTILTVLHMAQRGVAVRTEDISDALPARPEPITTCVVVIYREVLSRPAYRAVLPEFTNPVNTEVVVLTDTPVLAATSWTRGGQFTVFDRARNPLVVCSPRSDIRKFLACPSLSIVA